jgi:hypothetical protein
MRKKEMKNEKKIWLETFQNLEKIFYEYRREIRTFVCRIDYIISAPQKLVM